LPPERTDVFIRLRDNPAHDPGLCLWSGSLWVGYQRAYLPREVSHWRYPTTYIEPGDCAAHEITP
jgi:hypothetical protein